MFKIGNARIKDYITQGEVIILTHVFSVHKGSEYVSMVYNGTSSGLVDAFGATKFDLHTVRKALRDIDEWTFMPEKYLGKTFLDFILGKEVRPYCGEDTNHMRVEDNN